MLPVVGADALLKVLSDGWRPSPVFNKRNGFGQRCPGCEVSHDKGLKHHGRGSVAVRLARVNLDGDGLDGLRRMAVVMPTMPMIAIGSVDMGCLRLGDDHRCMRMCVIVCRAVFMATRAVKISFRLKRFVDGFNRQVHGAQHVG